jgi:hypothetical protein
LNSVLRPPFLFASATTTAATGGAGGGIGGVNCGGAVISVQEEEEEGGGGGGGGREAVVTLFKPRRSNCVSEGVGSRGERVSSGGNSSSSSSSSSVGIMGGQQQLFHVRKFLLGVRTHAVVALSANGLLPLDPIRKALAKVMKDDDDCDAFVVDDTRLDDSDKTKPLFITPQR